MGTPRFTPEFKEEAVRQITERGYSVAEVSDWLGVSAHSLYKWLRAGVVSKINHQAATVPAPGDRYTRGFLTGRPRIFSLFMALTYAMTSPTWPL